METLTDRQRNVANTLIDWALAHKDGLDTDMCMDETALAKAVDDGPWHRGYLEDLKALCNYTQRMDFPTISLLVVIPGFGKPERRIIAEAYKMTLSTAEGEKRWKQDLARIKKTKKATWDAFKKALEEQEEASKPKRAPRKTAKKSEKNEKAEKAEKSEKESD